MIEETTFRDPGEPPVLDWLNVDLIDVDAAYQRGLDEGRVLRILDWFAWSSFGAIVVAPVEGGRYHCTDGQHRLAAAKRHPKVTVVPAVIVPIAGTVNEASNFVSLNRDRKNISALDRYWAELAAEDPEAVTVRQVCDRAGVSVGRYPSPAYQAGQTIAVSAVRSVVDRWGAMRGREIMQVLARAGLAPIRGEHVRAAELLFMDDEFKSQAEPDALVEALIGNDEAIGIEARAFAKTHRMLAARAYANCWFRRCKKKRKP